MKTARIDLCIDGMSCQACATRIEKVLNRKDFVQEAQVNFAAETAKIHYDAEKSNVAELIALIEKIGFQAHLIDENSSLAKENEAEVPKWRLLLLLTLVLIFLPGMLAMLMGSHALMPPLWLQIIAATLVQLWLALPFYRSAWSSVKNGAANMDVLVSLGTLAIYLFSLFMLWQNQTHNVYFEASVMVIAFVSLGKHWEGQTKRNSLNSLGMLLQLTPKEVQVQRNGQWQTLPLNQIQSGDVLRVTHGGRIGADGIVIQGEAWADESHLTGESQAVFKQAGSRVLAGSFISGSLDYRAEQIGKQTLLGDMLKALNEAQNSKAPIARMADRAAAIFVPVVLLIALCTFLLTWYFNGNAAQALIHAVAVLVVACPCALGLATPAAIMAGMGVAVRHGVWFKNAATLERAGQTDTLVLDKTGTITEGKPQLQTIWTAPKISENEILRLATALEQFSTHPLANAIVQAAKARGIQNLPEIQELTSQAGAGLQAKINTSDLIQIGSPEFCNWQVPQNADWQNASIVVVSRNHTVIGALAFSDHPKAHSRDAIHTLQKHGIQVHMMSGDRESVVQHIAQQLGISQAQAQMLPRDKAQAIQQLMQQGHTVTMVGDGINDAPALAIADTGMAVYGSTDIAAETANVILMRQSALQITQALLIARNTLKTIKQNLFFAFIYNIIGIPLAALGMLTPALAGSMMAFSSISVLLNALRLSKLKI